MESEVHQRLLASQGNYINYRSLERQPICNAQILATVQNRSMVTLGLALATIGANMVVDRGRGDKGVSSLSVCVGFDLNSDPLSAR
ncbi:hypothetical protein BDE02_17G081700 [Populus trichocarpa]|jgi:hypothetical protein|nr:hypothetical protein BDE02_17G081700 [Populus trichocarpa]